MISPSLGNFIIYNYPEHGERKVIVLATLVSVLNLAFILFCVPESLPESVRKSSWGSAISWEQADPFAVCVFARARVWCVCVHVHAVCVVGVLVCIREGVCLSSHTFTAICIHVHTHTFTVERAAYRVLVCCCGGKCSWYTLHVLHSTRAMAVLILVTAFLVLCSPCVKSLTALGSCVFALWSSSPTSLRLASTRASSSISNR